MSQNEKAMICAGVGTKIDPTLCRADRMVGQVLGAVGALPEIFTELEISYFLLRRLLGVRTEGDKKAAKVSAAWVDLDRSGFTPDVGSQLHHFCVPAGPEVIQERGADGEHRLPVDRRPSQCRQGWFGKDCPHEPSVHGGGREDRPESACRETLAVSRQLWHAEKLFLHVFYIRLRWCTCSF